METYIKTGLKEIGCERCGTDKCVMGQEILEGPCKYGNKLSGSINGKEFLGAIVNFLRNNLLREMI